MILTQEETKSFLGRTQIAMFKNQHWDHSLLFPHRLQEVGRSSCGSSSWSYCPTAPMPAVSPGRGPMGSSRWRTPMRWPGAGESGRASPTWITTSWAGPSDITTTKTLWPKCMAKGMPTNLTSTALPRPCSRTPLSHPCTSTLLTSPTCLPTMPINRRWTLSLPTHPPCLSHPPASLEQRHNTGPPPRLGSTPTPVSPAILTPMCLHT